MATASTYLYGEIKPSLVLLTIFMAGALGALASIWLARVLRGLSELRDECDRLAPTDPLTGLHNRHAFFHHSKRAMAKARARNDHVTAMIVEIDQLDALKKASDARAADAALRNVAILLDEEARRHSLIVGRLREEELAIVHVSADPDCGRRIAERIRSRVEGAPAHYGSTVLKTTASIGAAQFVAPEDLCECLCQADTALRRARKTGRNRAVFFDPARTPA